MSKNLILVSTACALIFVCPERGKSEEEATGGSELEPGTVYPGSCEIITRKGSRRNWEFGQFNSGEWESWPRSSSCRLELVSCEVNVFASTRQIDTYSVSIKNISEEEASGRFEISTGIPVPVQAGSGLRYFSGTFNVKDGYKLSPGETRIFEFSSDPNRSVVDRTTLQRNTGNLDACPGGLYFDLEETAHTDGGYKRGVRPTTFCELGATETTHFKLCRIVYTK